MRSAIFGFLWLWMIFGTIVIPTINGQAATIEPADRVIVFRATSDLPDDAIRYIATVSEPEFTEIPANMQPEVFLLNHCGGSLTQTYLTAVRDANPTLVLKPIPQQRPIVLPACAKWTRQRAVKTRPGDNLETLIQREIGARSESTLNVCTNGLPGPNCVKTIRKILQILNGNQIASLIESSPGGTVVQLPITTQWTRAKIRSEYEIDGVIATLQKMVFAANKVEQKTVTRALISIGSSEDIEVLTPVSLNDLYANEQGCAGADGASDTSWPFDYVRVNNAIVRGIGKRRTTSRAIIRVLDTGFSGILQKRFPKSFLEPSAEKIGIESFGITPGPSISIDPVPDYEYSLHGTQVADIILGTSAFRNGFKDLQLEKLIGLHFAKIVNSIPIQGATNTAAPQYRHEIAPVFILHSVTADPPIARIINISVGSRKPYSNLEKAVTSDPHLLLVTAAGNTPFDLGSTGWYPANYGGVHSKQIISVGAHDRKKNITKFSGRSSDKVDLLAPGCDIPFESDVESDSGTPLNGTSFAAPFVTFTAGLLESLGLPPRSVKTRLWQSVDFNESLSDFAVSSGTLNIEKALYVFDDIVELTNSKDLIRGKWRLPFNVHLCVNRTFDRDEILKVTPIVGKDSKIRLRILLKDTDGNVKPLHCDSGVEEVQFESWSDHQVSLIKWSQVKDIVMRTLPSEN